MRENEARGPAAALNQKLPTRRVSGVSENNGFFQSSVPLSGVISLC